jgi:N-acetylglucosaminyldiphosphoundecaprenol N-acetyl-beta-D-mannosaminyltransferase
VNSHLIGLARRDPAYAALLAKTTLNYADGMSVVLAARALGYRIPERVPLTYVIQDLAANWAEHSFSVYFLGGKPGVAERAAAKLAASYPGFVVAGTQHGYFAKEETGEVLRRIAVSRAQILLVAFGNPAQEQWVVEHLDQINAGAILTCGGAFDWVSGERRPAPRWLGRYGLEWLYRMLQEPRRLGRRYLVGLPKFAGALLAALFHRDGAPEAPLPDDVPR